MVHRMGTGTMREWHTKVQKPSKVLRSAVNVLDL